MLTDDQNTFIELALERCTLRRALRVAVFVGILLNLINNFEKLIYLDFQQLNYFKVGLTFIVPYCVSTYSSVLANKNRRNAV